VPLLLDHRIRERGNAFVEPRRGLLAGKAIGQQHMGHLMGQGRQQVLLVGSK
jgi:hypothetical protein